ncbi:MAG: cation:proton antiporter [Actinomycetota bacterium]
MPSCSARWSPPTDPIAATSIGRRLGVPRRLVTVIESESLLNDASALVFYRTAVVATLAGTFSLWEAGAELVVNVVGGVAVGLVVGYVVRQVRKRLNDPPTEITVALITAYLAYLPAEALGVSAVLAARTGSVSGWTTSEARSRSAPRPSSRFVASCSVRRNRPCSSCVESA